MTTHRRMFGAAALLLGATTIATLAVAQQGDRSQDRRRDRAMQQDPMERMQEEMAAWQKYADPDEHHKLLSPVIGQFNAQVKSWMDPSQSDPMISTGTMTNTWVLGGRFVQQSYKGEFMGQPFEGMGMWGYDRYSGQYTGYWWDTWSTMSHESRGVVNEEGNRITMHSVMPDPAQGGRLVRTKDVTHIISDDKHTMVMFREMPDGAWMKAMEITFTRKRAG